MVFADVEKPSLGSVEEIEIGRSKEKKQKKQKLRIAKLAPPRLIKKDKSLSHLLR